MMIDKLVKDFEKATEGFVAEGVTSLEVGRGTYELHMKRYHVGEYGGVNIFGVKELRTKFYDWMTEDTISDMIATDEFPLNIRTFYKTEEGTELLYETYMFLWELPTREDIKAIIQHDMALMEGV